MPLTAALLVMHWEQFLALLGAGVETARFALEWKREPLPLALSGGTLTAAFRFEIVPNRRGALVLPQGDAGALISEYARARKR